MKQIFEDNVFAAERVLNNETVVLSVVVPFLRPTRLEGELLNRCIIVASSEEPTCQSDVAVIATFDLDTKITSLSPMRERKSNSIQLHQGIGASIIRGYATMLTALGIRVLIPIEMPDEEAERKRTLRKAGQGGWLVVEKPGIGKEPPKYRSSVDSPLPLPIGYELEEFDPTTIECYDMHIAILSEGELHRILDSEEAIVSFSDTVDDRHKDFPFWNALMGDPKKEKPWLGPFTQQDPPSPTEEIANRVSDYFKDDETANANMHKHITRNDVLGL